jgi:hypothetical protein
MTEYDKRKGHTSSKLHMINVSSNTVFTSSTGIVKHTRVIQGDQKVAVFLMIKITKMHKYFKNFNYLP